MKLDNKTSWSTRDLKKVLTEALKRDEKVEGKLSQRQRLIVNITAAKKWCYSGRAYLNGTWMTLKISGKVLDLHYLVTLFVHELQHIRGYRHKKMSKPNWGEKHSWTHSFSVGYKQNKLKADLQLKRYNNVLSKISEKTKAIKRLQDSLKKWRQKQRYYERTLVAAGKVAKK